MDPWMQFRIPLGMVWGVAVLLHLLAAQAWSGPSGTVKNAWPEYLGKGRDQVVKELTASSLVKNIYVLGPTYEGGDTTPSDVGKPDDVWMYIDGQDTVIEIPRRGPWHPNRSYPGWPKLLGQEATKATRTILRDFLGVTVQIVPEGFLQRARLAYRRDRVIIEVNEDGKVSNVPRVF